MKKKKKRETNQVRGESFSHLISGGKSPPSRHLARKERGGGGGGEVLSARVKPKGKGKKRDLLKITKGGKRGPGPSLCKRKEEEKKKKRKVPQSL